MADAEKGLIGAVLIDKSCIYDFYEKLKPEMFENSFCREAYIEILSMYDKGTEINLMTLAQNLESRNLDMGTIGEMLRECAIEAPTSTMAKSYSDTIIKSWKSRELKKLFQRVSLQPKDVENTIAECMTRLEELKANEMHHTMTAKELVETYEPEHFNSEVGKNAIRIGMYNLDECIGGLEPGDVMVIGARPAVGKSALSAQIIQHIASKGKKVGYFNMEMSNKQVYQRFISNISKISLTRIRRAVAFLGTEEEVYKRSNRELAKLNFEVNTNCRSISAVKTACKHQNYDFIVIDYLQLIQADRRYANRASEVGDISKAIKALAMELQVPILLLSQLNRTSEQKDTKEPTMAELRESGDIEQDASVIALLWNVSEKDYSLKGCKIDKNRMGTQLREGLIFHGDNMEFIESDKDFENFIAMARNIDKGTDFSSAYDSGNTPFGEDW